MVALPSGDLTKSGDLTTISGLSILISDPAGLGVVADGNDIEGPGTGPGSINSGLGWDPRGVRDGVKLPELAGLGVESDPAFLCALVSTRPLTIGPAGV